jgi:hypothetical protein
MDGFVPSPVGFGAAPVSHAPSSMVGAASLLPIGEATTDTPDYRAARRGAGFGLLMATAGTGAGLWFGGPLGAGAGLLLVGAARNTMRATRGWRDPDPLVRQDAGTSAALALFGALLGGYLGYHVYAKRTGE